MVPRRRKRLRHAGFLAVPMLPGIGAAFRRLQLQPEGGSFPWLGFDADVAAHAFNGFLDDGETDAVALVLVAEALEDFEDFGEIFRSDADAVVAEPEPDFAFPVSAETSTRGFTPVRRT